MDQGRVAGRVFPAGRTEIGMAAELGLNLAAGEGMDAKGSGGNK